MEDFKRVKDDSESCYSDNDLTSQMREKIRHQAQRLRALEQYRLLCEQRLQEIAPGHPLPVKQEHLGITSDLPAELQQAKQKISRLESMLAEHPEAGQELDYPELLEKYNSLVKDKNDLEESLRSEMLACEEQRTYIEVLKQAIESKAEHQVKSEKPNGKKPEENRREQTKLKNTLLDYESQIKRLQGLLKNKENELEAVAGEKKQLEAHLAQAAEALQIAEEEVDKLEEEKTNLLEYVDEHSSKELEMEKELNDLSRYFDTMKNDCEKLKNKLEEETKAKKQLEVKAEVLQEEVFKASQVIKDLQSVISGFKSASDDKETAVKRLKEEKMALDIRAESLQATCKQLEDSLKDAQVEFEDLFRQFEGYKRAETDKSSDLARMKVEVLTANSEKDSLTAAVKELRQKLEEEKRDRQELERMREMDIQQIQDFKQNLAKCKNRCENLEESAKQQAETQQFRLLDEQKLTQLQEDFNYLQEVYRETQQRELIQAEALNELRKHNTDLSRELEDLYKENENLAEDLAKKSQDFESLLKKFEHASQVSESLESDKKVLEMHLKGEKNTVKSFKEQAFIDRAKLEEYTKQLNTLHDSYERSLKKIKNLEDDLLGLKGKLKSKERENEEEKFRAKKLNEEVLKISAKLEQQEIDNEKLQSDIVDCCKVVAGFAGKYTVTAHDYRSQISQGYKEFLLMWKDKISSSPKILQSWIQSTIEEIESLAKAVLGVQKDQASQMSEIKKLNNKLEGISNEDLTHKQENSRLKLQLDQTAKKYDLVVDSTDKEISALRVDLANAKKENSSLTHELGSLKDALKLVRSENHELKVSSDLARTTLKSQEDRVNLLKTEKAQLEDLLAQVQRTIGSSEISKIYNEIFRIKGELEIVEREKINLECQLLKYESDRKARDSEGFRELSKKLTQCERQIRNFKKNMQILQDDANKEEMVQKLRTVDKIGKTRMNLTGQSHVRKTESPQVLRQKSAFS